MRYPDDDINVATCDQHGEVKVYGRLNADEVTRDFLYSKAFPNYGSAKLWADEYEDVERKNRPLRAR